VIINSLSYPPDNIQELVDNGNRIPEALLTDFMQEKMQEKVRLYDANGRFIGIYSYLSEGKEFKPIKLFME
jgi:tRNA pseudouridine55 synthase